uniref:Exonuclease 1 n=1 Tax=Macrostomum lignano TaxID=282301 RepID=A0A1I8HPI4_9PLAT
LLAEGRSAEAREAFERCIDVTPSMALALMRSARKEGADTIVAPYEADAQLTHLCNAGLVDAVISEDSDLLAFGCKRVIFKLDSQGNGLLMDRRQIARQLCIPASADDPNSAEATGSTGMTWAKFRWMCILSGCDYFSGVPGVGLATAAGIVKRTCLDLRGLANKLFLYAKKVQRLTVAAAPPSLHRCGETDSTNSIGIGATSSSAAGVGSTERLCRLYSSLSSDSLLAAEVATVAETDEKENSETSARLDDEIPANQAWPADVVE